MQTAEHPTQLPTQLAKSSFVMDEILQRQLDRLESALATLTDSISSYNPSIPAAQNLLAADDELQQGLQQLHIHQRNCARIQELQTLIERQNAQIDHNFLLLTNTRAELRAVREFKPPKERKEVDTTELLSFAQKISRFSLPTNFKATSTPGQKKLDDTAPTDGDAASGEGAKKEAEGIGLESLLDREKQWLDPWTGVQFTPWPSEEVIRSSALARIQAEGETGEEMEGVESSNPAKAEGAEGLEGIEQRAEQAKPRPSVGEARQLPEKKHKPKLFTGLDLYDPYTDD